LAALIQSPPRLVPRSSKAFIESFKKSCQEELGDKRVLKHFSKMTFDTQEVQDTWWCQDAAESAAALNDRAQEFMSQLLYAPHRSIIVVGHSHFFRAVFKKFLSDDFRKHNPALAQQIASMKLPNCGVARAELDPSKGLNGPITRVELVLQTELVAESSSMACCSSHSGSANGFTDPHEHRFAEET